MLESLAGAEQDVSGLQATLRVIRFSVLRLFSGVQAVN